MTPRKGIEYVKSPNKRVYVPNRERIRKFAVYSVITLEMKDALLARARKERRTNSEIIFFALEEYLGFKE